MVYGHASHMHPIKAKGILDQWVLMDSSTFPFMENNPCLTMAHMFPSIIYVPIQNIDCPILHVHVLIWSHLRISSHILMFLDLDWFFLYLLNSSYTFLRKSSNIPQLLYPLKPGSLGISPSAAPCGWPDSQLHPEHPWSCAADLSTTWPGIYS